MSRVSTKPKFTIIPLILGVFIVLLTFTGIVDVIFQPAVACDNLTIPPTVFEKPSVADTDDDGWVYIAGYTNAPSFKSDGTPRNSDNETSFGLFIIKMDPGSQSVNYSSWYYQPGYVDGKGIVIDREGSPQILVYSESPYPFQWSLAGENSPRGAYVTRLNSFGTGVSESYRIFTSDHLSVEPISNPGRGPDGSLYIGIDTNDKSFPVTKDFFPDEHAGQAIIVMKIAPNGKQIIFADRIASKRDNIISPAMDVAPDGSVYITGFISRGGFGASGFQNKNNGDTEGFVAKISPDGEKIEYLTYLGGTSYDSPRSIRVGSEGSAYVAGVTNSDDFPLKHQAITNRTGDNEGFATKISPDGEQIIWSTYIGEINGPVSIVPTKDGGAWVAGGAGSSMFNNSKKLIGETGNGDVFLLKISPEGQIPADPIIIGGQGQESAIGMVLDKNGNPFIYGSTTSYDFPMKNANNTRFVPGTGMFAASFNASDDTMNYATFIGGPTAYSAIESPSKNNIIESLDEFPKILLGAFHSTFVGKDYC